MAEAVPGIALSGSAVRRVRALSWLTIGWLLVDGAVGMTAGLAADSVALICWGLDCAVQAGAAVVILWRFGAARIDSAGAERLAQLAVGASFFLLAPYIVAVAIDRLVTGDAAGAGWLGVGLAATDAVLMPSLGRAKQRVGTRLGSLATCSEGRQNVLCAYLSVAVLVGLAANAVAGWWWADPLVALLVAVVVVQAGVRSWRGEPAPTC